MADSPSKWTDLSTRVISAVVLVALVVAALFGPFWTWPAFLTLMVALAFWELARLAEPAIAEPRRQIVAGLMALVVGAAFATLFATAGVTTLGLFLLPLLIGAVILRQGRWVWLAYGLMLILGVQFLAAAYDAVGPVPVLLLIGLIAISDTAAYFTGRALGGPKFWPKVSPKKTWSGTIGGWIAAGIFGGLVAPWALGFTALAPISAGLAVVISVGLAFAGQMGDIAESALKRRVGIKDSSALIPGHGGVLDRIDALIAAAALAGLGWHALQLGS